MFLRRAVQQIPLQFMLVAAAALLAMLRLFLFADEGPSACEPFMSAYGRNPVLFSMLSLLLLSASAVFLQVFMRYSRMVENSKYYPLMLLPLLLLLFMQASDWVAFCFVFLFCSFVCPALFSVYVRETYRQNAGLVFGMMCGCMSLVYAPLVLLILFYYVLLGTHRLLNFRSLLLPIVGLALFAVYCCFFCYLAEFPLHSLLRYQAGQWCGLRFRLPSSGSPLPSVWALFLLYVPVAYRIIGSLYTKNIIVRKKCVLLFFLSLFFLLLFLLTPYGNPVPLCGFAVVLLMMLCVEEAYLKRRLLYNLLFALCWVLDVLIIVW